MAKKTKKAESSKRIISKEVMTVTEIIGQLCEESGLVPTDTYAVKKELEEHGESKKVHFTRWAINSNGERCLVVLNETKNAISDYSDYRKRYASMRTLKEATA